MQLLFNFNSEEVAKRLKKYSGTGTERDRHADNGNLLGEKRNKENEKKYY
jgi:hypothetical protein